MLVMIEMNQQWTPNTNSSRFPTMNRVEVIICLFQHTPQQNRVYMTSIKDIYETYH